MTRRIGLGLVAAALFGIAGQAQAATITVNDFTTITDGVFFDIPNTVQTSPPAQVGGVTVTGNPGNTTLANSGFLTTPTPAVPGNNAGWTLFFGLETQVILDFDITVAAFGMSVVHGSSAPSGTLEAFSGAGGNGASLGSVSSQPGNGTSDSREFIGLWSDALDIQSVVFSIPNSPALPLTVDVYALSLTANVQTQPGPSPEPDEVSEPAALSLFGLGIAALGMVWRRRSR